MATRKIRSWCASIEHYPTSVDNSKSWDSPRGGTNSGEVLHFREVALGQHRAHRVQRGSLRWVFEVVLEAELDNVDLDGEAGGSPDRLVRLPLESAVPVCRDGQNAELPDPGRRSGPQWSGVPPAGFEPPTPALA